MARLVVRKEQGPMEIKCGAESKWICRCGLSKDQPWCDGSHNKTRDEQPGKFYFYEENQRREVNKP